MVLDVGELGQYHDYEENTGGPTSSEDLVLSFSISSRSFSVVCLTLILCALVIDAPFEIMMQRRKNVLIYQQ